MSAASILATNSFFKALSESHRKAIAAACVPRPLEKRDHLFMEGQQADAVYLLESGSVQLVKTAADGREIVIRTVEPGELFAEAILFTMDTYPVSAVSLARGLVYRLPKRDFAALLDDASFRDDFIAGLMGRLHYLTDRILNLTVYDVDQRFFRFLEQQYGRQQQYDIALSKKDMASAIGTTPETLSRLLLRLGRNGTLNWKGKVIRLAPGFWDTWDG